MMWSEKCLTYCIYSLQLSSCRYMSFIFVSATGHSISHGMGKERFGHPLPFKVL